VYAIAISTAAAIVVGATIVLLILRICFATCLSYAETFDPVDLSWCDYRPLRRLLDPAEFEYLRARGINEAELKELRAKRRRIFRLCLRSLACNFNSVESAIKLVLVRSPIDRPDLIAELAKQKVMFYRSLLVAETWLVLHACGFDRMPDVELLQPLRSMQTQLRQLAPDHMLARSVL